MLRKTAGRRLRAWVSGPSLLPETQALIARFTTPPTTARALLINDLIGSLIAAGIWSKLDALYVMAQYDAQAARRNWIADQYNLTSVSGPSFAADRGYTGDGTTSYLSTSFNPSTAVSPKYTITNGHQGIWSRTNLANAGSDSPEFGGSARAYLARSGTTPGLMRGRIQTVEVNIATGAFPGHGIASRTASNVWEGYAQGVDAGGGTETNISIGNETWRVLSNAAAFGVNQIAAAHSGAGLSSAEALALYSALNTYLQAVGAA